MKTTQLIIDHLITGTMTLIWIIFFVLSAINIELLNQLPDFEGFENLIIAFLIAIVYPLGIITDNLADKVLKGKSKSIRKSIVGGNQSMRQLLLKLDNTETTEYFDYLRTRIRICRSAAFNFSLITISSLVLATLKLNVIYKGSLVVIILITGISLTIAALYSWKLLVITFAKSIAKRYKELQ